MKNTYKLIVLLSILLFISCSDDKTDDPIITPDDRTYELVWEDEFDGTGKPNASKWGYEMGYIRNNEAQLYTDNLSNAHIEDGYLVLEARKEDITIGGHSAQYSSASITTQNKISWAYGKIEVKAKLPSGRGIWPAIWTLGDNISQVGWPKCGEIDIMEHVGYEPKYIYGNIHTKSFNHAIGTNKGAKQIITNPYNDFHVYAIEWTTKKIDILLDGNVYFTFKKSSNSDDEWPFDKRQFLILNIAVGGGWGGQQGIDDSIFPQQMTVDYVRVYQLK